MFFFCPSHTSSPALGAGIARPRNCASAPHRRSLDLLPHGDGDGVGGQHEVGSHPRNEGDHTDHVAGEDHGSTTPLRALTCKH